MQPNQNNPGYNRPTEELQRAVVAINQALSEEAERAKAGIQPTDKRQQATKILQAVLQQLKDEIETRAKTITQH